MKRLNYRLVARLTGMLMLIMAASVVLPIAVSLHYGDGAQYGLAIAGVVMAAVGLLLRNIVGRNASYELHARESFWITSIVWLAVPLCGALPYLFTGVLDRFTDAAFESVSGFTTTGSSVILNPAAIPQGILLWRAITQWIGGLGLILFVIAILKRLNRGSMQLYAAEFSGTQQRKLHPHIAKSVSRMWRIYSFLTLLLVALLVLADNLITDATPLRFCTKLTHLELQMNRGIRDFSFLPRLAALRELNVCYDPWCVNLDFLESMPDFAFGMFKFTDVDSDDYSAWADKRPDARLVYWSDDTDSNGNGWRDWPRNRAIRELFADWQAHPVYPGL